MNRLTERDWKSKCAGYPWNVHPVKDIDDLQYYKKLAAYEDAEEQGFMKILPVTIGSDVYFIPSKVNYDLNVLSKHEENNRVYHQKVARVTFTERGWYLECDKDLEYGVDHILVDKFYKETWFTSSEEAEQALAKLK